MSDYEDLLEDLWQLYFAAGREVTYVTPEGERRAYWAKDYRLALEQAGETEEVVGFVERLVAAAEPSRGFGHMREAGRLHLTVEALVADPARSYHGLFSAEVVQIARERLEAAGYRSPAAALTRGSAHATRDQETIIVRVHRDGTVAFCLHDRIVTATGASEAMRTFQSALDEMLGGASPSNARGDASTH